MTIEDFLLELAKHRGGWVFLNGTPIRREAGGECPINSVFRGGSPGDFLIQGKALGLSRIDILEIKDAADGDRPHVYQAALRARILAAVGLPAETP